MKERKEMNNKLIYLVACRIETLDLKEFDDGL